MKILKMFLVVLAFVLMSAVVMFIDDAPIIDVIAGSFFLVISGFLGVDLVSMVKDSNKLPSGEFKAMKFYRYVVVLVMMLVLFGLSIYRKETDGVQMLMSISTFGGGAMVTIGLMLTGLEGNKIASRTDG